MKKKSSNELVFYTISNEPKTNKGKILNPPLREFLEFIAESMARKDLKRLQENTKVGLPTPNMLLRKNAESQVSYQSQSNNIEFIR